MSRSDKRPERRFVPEGVDRLEHIIALAAVLPSAVPLDLTPVSSLDGSFEPIPGHPVISHEFSLGGPVSGRVTSQVLQGVAGTPYAGLFGYAYQVNLYPDVSGPSGPVTLNDVSFKFFNQQATVKSFTVTDGNTGSIVNAANPTLGRATLQDGVITIHWDLDGQGPLTAGATSQTFVFVSDHNLTTQAVTMDGSSPLDLSHVFPVAYVPSSLPNPVPPVTITAQPTTSAELLSSFQATPVVTTQTSDFHGWGETATAGTVTSTVLQSNDGSTYAYVYSFTTNAIDYNGLPLAIKGFSWNTGAQTPQSIYYQTDSAPIGGIANTPNGAPNFSWQRGSLTMKPTTGNSFAPGATTTVIMISSQPPQLTRLFAAGIALDPAAPALLWTPA